MTRVPPDYEDALNVTWDPRFSQHPPGIRGWAALHVATTPRAIDSRQIVERNAELYDLPRWPSTNNYIETQCGGFYGLSVLGGFALKGLFGVTL